MEFHHTQWQIAFDADKPKAAAKHQTEYINYKTMYEQSLERGTANEIHG